MGDEEEVKGNAAAAGGGAKRARLETGTVTEEDADAQLWSMLEEELQEKIIARLPLTLLYQTLATSKAWSQKIKSRAFQSEVSSASEVSKSWPSLCPLHVGSKGLIGYDHSSKQWQKLFSLEHILAGADAPALELCSGVGPLICYARRQDSAPKKSVSWVKAWGAKDGGGAANANQMALFRRKTHQTRNLGSSPSLIQQNFDILVTNVVTKSWKILPPRPNMHRPHIMHMLRSESDGYQVILLTRLDDASKGCHETSVCAQSYDSATDSWTEDHSTTSYFRLRNSLYAYFQKKIHIVCLDHCKVYDLERKSWTDIPSPCFKGVQDPGLSLGLGQVHAGVVVCDSSVMLVMAWNGLYSPSLKGHAKEKPTMFVSRFDPELQEFTEVARGPPAAMSGAAEAYVDTVAGNGDVIYFGSRYVPSSPVITFDVGSQEWSSFTSAMKKPAFHDSLDNFQWASFTFQPSLAPFVDI